MTHTEEQQFLNGLEKKLWTAADKLRSTLDAAQYKHTVLGLVFIKYVSDAFDIRRTELEAQLKDPAHDYFLDPEDFGGSDSETYQAEIESELEVRDYFLETNTFWVPTQSRWQFLQENNKAVIGGAKLTLADGSSKKFSSIGHLIDNALEKIEADNPRLRGVLNKLYTRLQIDQAKLGELIDLIATVPFTHQSLNSKDILGHVYEYMLGQFALAEGKKGGQFYTPKSIVSLIVQMLEPFKGRVYDPAMGSGGFFVQSEHFINAHKGRIGDVSIYGQEYNHTTWQLAAMNMVIRGIDFNFGKEPANTYTNDQHLDLRADFVMANPPFNMKEWDAGVSSDDKRWAYGTPPSGNANFAWLQHMLYHLAPNGSMGLLLANGSMSSNTKNEGTIRKALIENDRVECMVALPGQLFTNTQIPACIWFLTKNKGERTSASGKKLRDRAGEVLFIDARNLGYMKDRVLRDFTPEDLNQVTETFHNWQTGENYEDVAGFVKSAQLEELQKHDYVLTPGRYVGAAAEEEDGEPFAEKMARLTGQLRSQFEEADRLEGEIKKNLAGLGYDV
ncbi:MAG: type I restriction-modification system subunit M [Thiotrichales bacterium]|jgi:type I restriction enzyme M protein|nr:type I restriction-modification system subunit M [Thiotrichales bacterium]MBT5635212.1 type I restriction-modification system subunit M [Gammaproteobacteria bacterium]MBT6078957.1 type I restriction-modification system subunit M [Gammaproteobacteria bacterium]MBT7830293.1 type I restriction-modification system subunit M [Candidatus Neomarinimicrobiota bacterium]